MKRTHALLTAVLLGGAAAAAPHAAQAAQNCGSVARTSYFGTVTTVHPAYFTLHTNAAIGSLHVYTHGAHVNYNGQALRPGVWAGVYGCNWRSRDGLVAEDVTLSSTQASYPGDPDDRYTSGDRVVQGRIDSVRADRILIDSGNGHGNTWVLTNGAQSFQTGELVRATGSFSQRDRAFVATNVEVMNGAYPVGASNADVIEGRIHSVEPGRVLVASGGGHGNVWVLTNTSGLRTGELVRVTGRFNTRDRAFVATGLTIEAM
ncbi:MAG TPA: hypothetical protein VFN49_08900 [Candidatus Aquilonibacter sp.]|nr:hypothetical protein [Candidatus Aquilonibacter sp.]